MTRGDSYYYSRPGVTASFPVYRLVQDDAQQTRIYLDPITGIPVSVIDSDGRWYRWLHVGLHTLDFSSAIRARPVWDLLMLTSCSPGWRWSVASAPGWVGAGTSPSSPVARNIKNRCEELPMIIAPCGIRKSHPYSRTFIAALTGA